MVDYLIAGSGPAGVAAAYALRGTDCLILDPGSQRSGSIDLSGNLFDLRQRSEDLFDELIGENFESLHNLHQRPISLKLKAPGMRHIVAEQDVLCPIISDTFETSLSFATGGLANAWGAGVYKFSDADLRSFPIRASDLDPYYDELTELIGIAGENDDLAPFLRPSQGLLPPLRLSSFFSEMIDRYVRLRPNLNHRGIFLGRSRLAVLTKPHRNRPAYGYENLEFFQPLNPGIYNPAFTLRELTDAGQARYERGYLVTSYVQREGFVEVFARRLDTGTSESFQARRLLIAAGTVNTARLVLASTGAHHVRVPILDNAMSCIPLVRLSRIGSARDPNDSSLAQLNMVYDGPLFPEVLQAALYGTAGPLRSDVALHFPLTIRGNLECARYLSPAIGLLMLFYPDDPRPSNFMQLREDGRLEIHYQETPRRGVERGLISAFRRMGYLSSIRLCQFPRIGSGLHYAGSLPMKASPGPFELYPDGRLYGTEQVYVVDGAAFSRLPAKNLTFTIMANAMRIASLIRSA